MKPTTHRIRRGLKDLATLMYRERTALTDLRMLPLGTNVEPHETPIPGADAPGWMPVAPGQRWGGRDENVWLHGAAQIPKPWADAATRADGRHAIALRLLLGVSEDFGWPEGLLYVNGRLLQGINQHHEDVLLPGSLASGELTFDVRAWSGLRSPDHRLEYADIALLDRTIESLYHLLLAGCDQVDALDANDPLLHPLAEALALAYDQIDLREPTSPQVEISVSQALDTLRTRLESFRSTFTLPGRPQVTAIGHGHLDVAWLWQTHHTREKTARTFGIATALMSLYPDYHFLHTTPQVYAWLERDYPELFARVRERIAEGRFEAAGAMWLESDTNIVSGESLVRQILYGQRYLRETFGADAEYQHLWLPDTFGYSYALPQILLRSGLRSFMTTKMSWSDTNRIPYDTFHWRGLDGSETLAHFVTTPWLPFNQEMDTDTYNGRLDVPAVRKLWERYRNKDINSELLLIYGHGDGGAGPTRQHIESFQALRQLPGLPDVSLGRADEYFTRLRERVWDQPRIPTWDGEMYFEYHRGVYTTQAWLKRLHRRIEERLLLAESLDAARWAYAHVGSTTAPDARPFLDDAWRTLLLHEFHDILPGSSIGPVYDDARAVLTDLARQLDAFIHGCEGDILGQAEADNGSWQIHNPSPCETPGSSALLMVPLTADASRPSFLADHHPLPAQIVTDAEGARAVLIETPPISGRGWLTLTAGADTEFDSEQAPTATTAPGGGAILENALYRVSINAQGEIDSIVDKRAGHRELLLTGRKGNAFVAFDDRPRNFDAWDIDAGYDRKPYPLPAMSVTVTERGPVRATVHITRRFLSSVVEQDISLYRILPRIDFATHVDWHEHHLLLKVTFPLDLRTTTARSEIQYGSLERATHRNTSWDQARFETVAHRWVDLSESDYGVALLNDGRYGHDIADTVVRLTILRSPTSPDPNADQGAHDVTFSLLPHLGSWPSGDVIAHGYALNRPLLARAGFTQSPQPLFTVEGSSVIIEAIKRAADGDDLLVRLYEATGSRCAASVHAGTPVAAVIETDLLERPLTPTASPGFDLWQASPVASHDAPELTEDGWKCHFRPFEIRTFRVTLRQA